MDHPQIVALLVLHFDVSDEQERICQREEQAPRCPVLLRAKQHGDLLILLLKKDRDPVGTPAIKGLCKGLPALPVQMGLKGMHRVVLDIAVSRLVGRQKPVRCCGKADPDQT